jgi:hypothetical protein
MLNESQEQHEMVLETIHPSGAEEWFCPTCGRRFLMQWPPAYNKVILEPGNESAIHSGGRGGLSIQSSEPQPAEVSNRESILTEQDEAYLVPWAEWMERVDFEKLWE